jgi:arylformamidase
MTHRAPSRDAWRAYAGPALERQYAGISPADFNTRVVPDWIRRSAAFRDRSAARLGLAYGPGPRERLDIFPGRPGAAAATVVFFHGGYWQRFDPSVFSFVAEGLAGRGISVVMPGYDLCPAVRVGAIVEQARRAVLWTWRNAVRLGLGEQVFVAGHSAGGHLAARLMAMDPGRPDALPPDLLKGAVPISGLFDLEPLRHTSINEALGLDRGEAAAESPLALKMASDAPQLVVCGDLEPAEFHRQSDIYAAAFLTASRRMERWTVPGRGHMDELDALADPHSEFVDRVVALIDGVMALS